MKVKFHDYEISISAKMVGSTKASKLDAMYLLNFISVAMRSGANWQDAQGCNYIADDMRRCATDIFETLDSYGFYKRLDK